MGCAPMTAYDFREAGERLYGHEWRKPLAQALQVAPVTVWRWSNGLTHVPYTVELALLALRVKAALGEPL